MTSVGLVGLNNFRKGEKEREPYACLFLRLVISVFCRCLPLVVRVEVGISSGSWSETSSESASSSESAMVLALANACWAFRNVPKGNEERSSVRSGMKQILKAL